uniref:histidine kinase n=1 Tax=Aegilops tauschii TaxID=37682 RepID=R7WDI1_AEGTA
MDYQKMRRCGDGCDGAVDAMLQCQKVSDFLIAASYLSIPLELLYFASCADLAPVKWLLLQLAAFAVLGGAVHLLAVLTHHHPHSSGLLLASTAAKLLAALVSLATALSLLTFIPRLIRAKLREALLRAKARQLHRDVGLIRRRVEATSRVVRMLSRHIRDSPHDHHAILHTTMLHLADALALHSCAVWVPVPGDVLQLVGMQTKFPRRSASSDMGLSFGMCNKIVQMMNGSMRSSGSDGGSIITVVLQFQLQQSGVRRRTSPPSIPRFDGLRVLLADSDGTSRGVTGMLLEKLGCQVMPAPSGAHCLRLLESAGSCFQLVLLDLDKHAPAATMEDVFEVALRIGELGSGGWLLVLAALAVGDVDDRVLEVCQRSGINGVIQKPVTLVALGAQLAAALQNN